MPARGCRLAGGAVRCFCSRPNWYRDEARLDAPMCCSSPRSCPPNAGRLGHVLGALRGHHRPLRSGSLTGHPAGIPIVAITCSSSMHAIHQLVRSSESLRTTCVPAPRAVLVVVTMMRRTLSRTANFRQTIMRWSEPEEDANGCAKN